MDSIGLGGVTLAAFSAVPVAFAGTSSTMQQETKRDPYYYEMDSAAGL